uniref:Uncharacterized protein n=1 Tax=viral metagenome TaxID=1070528 RepID=A0A6C0JXF0_9ZZZZ
MSRYVDPMDVVDRNAKPLTEKETDFQMQDSFRTGRVFIKDHQDPLISAVGEHYVMLLNQLKTHVASLLLQTKKEMATTLTVDEKTSSHDNDDDVDDKKDPPATTSEQPATTSEMPQEPTRQVQSSSDTPTPQEKEISLIFKELDKHFSTTERPVQAYCWHLFDKPYMVQGTDGKMYPQYGWMKLRGQFSTYGEMEMEIRPIMQDHDSYTRTHGQQKGVFFPITNAPFVTEENMKKVYDDDVKRRKDIDAKMVELTRKREDALQEMQKDVEPGSLHDYIRQKLKFCVADTMIQKGNANVKRFTPILAKQEALVSKMETDHPEYNTEGFKMYQEKMNEIGFPAPSSWYDGCIPIGAQ